jgi:hypothetical protein
MDLTNRSFLIAVFSACLVSRGVAEESKPSLESVLVKWEAATAKVKTLDAKVYLWRYDRVFSSPKQDAEPDEGRFFYEGPNSGCLQWTKTVDGCGRTRPSAFVWREKDSLEIDADGFRCRHIVWPETPPGAATDILSAELSNGFFAALSGILYSMRDPRNMIPLSVGVHVGEIEKHFKLSVEDRRDQFFITAIPIKSPKEAFYSKIEVLVDRKTYLTAAVRLSTPSSKNQTVWMLEDVKINKRPPDRDQLLSPDLHRLSVNEINWR